MTILACASVFAAGAYASTHCERQVQIAAVATITAMLIYAFVMASL